MRLGFAVKVLGRSDLKSNDARRWQSNPHLRVSIEYLHAIFLYLARHDVRMYRMSSDLAPYLTHPDLPQFHGQIAEARSELEALGKVARDLDLRLSFHPSQYIILNSPDKKVVTQSVKDLIAQAEMLDIMGQGPEAVLVIHVGGHYGDRAAGRLRWAETYEGLPEPVRRRLVLENDDIRYSAADVLAVHDLTGVPLVFDHQHHWCNNPERLTVRAALEKFLKTWPAGVRPKVHYSSPRTELREVKRKNKATGKNETALIPPIWTGHADFVNPFEFALFLDVAAGLEFDVMLEAKAKDLALFRLYKDLPRYVPEHAARFGLEQPTDADADPAEEGGAEDTGE
ncbi:MAG: UV DNA damage repair endonuclease UvsE [Gemmataceae bacterium]|nr:UV DNA damage repair endonuclease UvsE [Gemmataceae bacterium]